MNSAHQLWTDFFSKRNQTRETIMQALKQNRLFAGLTQRELDYIYRMVHLRQYDAQEVVFLQGEKGSGMYIIAKGSIEIRAREKDQLSDLSNETPVHDTGKIIVRLTKDSFFGELALIDEYSKRTATAICQEPSTLIGFFKPDLLEIFDRRPSLGVKILVNLCQVLGRRLSETTEELSRITHETIISTD